ncbi:MAG: hypothetical protein QM796_12255 [Chthoniobacteraceae bacterium]
MKFRAPSSIEPLESRIAPATIYIGSAVASVSKGYTDTGTPFSSVASNSNFAAAMGSSSDTYYLSLHAGDKVMLYTNTQLSTFITVTSGNAVVFFHDDNSDGRAESTEISGVALGKNVSMTIAGPVNGDVATNLNDDGTLTLNSTGLNAYAVKSLVVSGGGITGGVYAGGAINKLNVAGDVTNVITGTAANGFAYDYNGSATAGGQSFSVTAASGQAGPNIMKVNVVSTTLIEAGDGGAGGKGGSLSGITITNDTDGFTLQAGSGGDGDATHVNGGAGGTITNTYINGPVSTSGGSADTTPNSLVNIYAGSGGDAFTSTAKGGAGGLISQLYIGYKASSGGPILSTDFIQDNVLVQAGNGGDGGKAGAGGSVTNSQISTITPDDTSSPSIIELQVLGGIGGSTVDGTAGKGGAVQAVKVRDLNSDVTTAGTSDILVAAGDAGSVSGSGKGAAGGSASSIFLVGFQIAVTGGTGSGGENAGGNGGSVTGITVSNTVAGVINNSLVLTAGNGGGTTNGKAGVGGSVSGVTALDVNFTDPDPSDSTNEGLVVTAGTGGSSTNGQAANGGSVSNFTVTDELGSEAYFVINAGDGGTGATKAGNGGSISSINSSGDGLSVIAQAGDGGATTLKGGGGAGGSFNGNAFVATGTVNSSDATISVTAGVGGTAATLNGGSGGSITNTSLVSVGDVTVLAGAGGAGATSGHAGNGGSISNSSGQASDGSVSFTAGSANATGGKSGTGGSITNASILGLNSVTIIGGNGTNGGAGGSLTGVGFSGASNGVAPLVNVTVQAGAGSAANSAAGAGGSIVNMTGYVGEFGNTVITAGSVSGSATVGGAGGSINGLTILGGGSSSAIMTIAAGDASDATLAKTGAAGGSVTNVTILGSDGSSSGVDQGTIIRSIAAGDGGDATKTGGTGGSITNIFVTNHDIGVRSGVSYGYSTMGGLFAGLGGLGASSVRATNGDVINVTADAIAAIVAGKSTIDLVNKVDKIYLDGHTAPTIDSTTGAYTNIDSANFVGGVADPNASNASTYHYADNDSSGTFDPTVDTPIDGLIAAKTLTANRNFTPGALLTLDGSGNYVLVDPTNV